MVMTRPSFDTALKKGAAGEVIVKGLFERKGWVVYRPETEGPHQFDILAIKDKVSAVAVDVKTKSRMNWYPATGVNQSHFEEYSRFSKKHLMPFWIIFVDEKQKTIYGNTISELEKPRCVDRRNYPFIMVLKCGTQIRLWPLEAMETIATIDNNTATILTNLSQRSYGYEFEGRP